MSATPPFDDQRERASAFRRLHADGIFVMPCAWDAGSALAMQAAGFAAIGTTSGGVNWSRGRLDYVYATPRHHMLDDYRAVAGAVTLPVSGDLENGYGDEPEVVASTVHLAIEAGMVGGSIEDQPTEPGPGLLPIALAVERIEAARATADRLLPDFVLTARAESFFAGDGDGDPDEALADAVERANRYVDAGADCIFVPGPTDLPTLRRLVDDIDAPISLGIGSGGGRLRLDDLAAIGVRRVSTGGALPRAVYGLVADAGAEMLTDGTFGFTARAVDEAAVNRLMDRAPR
ncbi:MAG: isocitrate lyase/phosphoenolpyruvate mutase family protein [Actinomycetota bacterium]